MKGKFSDIDFEATNLIGLAYDIFSIFVEHSYQVILE